AGASHLADVHSVAFEELGVDKIGRLIVGDQPNTQAALEQVLSRLPKQRCLSRAQITADKNHPHRLQHESSSVMSCRSAQIARGLSQARFNEVPAPTMSQIVGEKSQSVKSCRRAGRRWAFSRRPRRESQTIGKYRAFST